jgi:Uma2 family endonuclease
MTAHAPVMMTKQAFLAWAERREQRYEYAGGRVIMMVNVTRNHARMTTNLVVALRARLQAEQYDIAAEAFAVHVGDSVRFPDVLVEPAQADGGEVGAKAPVLIIEVLSPGSLHLDFGDKPREYLSLSSLDTYLVVSPDEPRLWVWQRADGKFPQEPEMIEGVDRHLALPALEIEIPLAEIYRGVR